MKENVEHCTVDYQWSAAATVVINILIRKVATGEFFT